MKKIIGIVTFGILSLLFFNSFGATIILTSDNQLNALLNPDNKIDLSTGHQKRFASLREICEQAKKRGDHTLTIAFDEFFRQYREHAATERKLTPDMDEYVEKIKTIANFAAKYDMGMGLSLLSPLELGPAFKNQTGENGTWLHYKVGLRDPQTGKFHVPLWQQLVWSNNKGNFALKLKSYKAYAFKENHISNTPYKVVDRDDILPLSQIEMDEWSVGARKKTTYAWDATPEGEKEKERAKRVAVFSDGSDELQGYDRVLVLLEYEVPEMEYFSSKSLPFLKDLLKKYNDEGIKVEHFYSDEMHIQQDWIYFDHHDNGQLALRYYSPSMGKIYEEKHGVPFEEKDLLYFSYGADIDSKSARATQNVQYVFGQSPEEIHKTFLFRDRYYKLLNNHVVDLFKNAKQYASELFGVDDFGTFGHSSWAESPTIDLWNTGKLHENAYRYEYTPNFIWGNTVHQAAAACYDYFKWGEYLEPTRNDFAECGWNDRNYYGAAMSASIGVLNRYPYSYPAFWGMPNEVKIRKGAINDAFGGRTRSKAIEKITDKVHRDVDVLMLYPMNLVAVEERFGSWVTQYGYANFITSEKLLELGSITENGEIKVKDKTYTTLVALFEPLPQKGLLKMMNQLSENGGRTFWFGTPPIINGNGEPCLNQWQDLFGVDYDQQHLMGQIATGKQIQFINEFVSIPSQFVLSDFVHDRIHPVSPRNNTMQLAKCHDLLVGTKNKNAYFFGFRPRDDQAASLGYETRTLFEILDMGGAYPSTGKFENINDNPEHVSRNSDYLCTRFPNGATIVVKHYRRHKETWPGGFSREAEVDARVLKENPLPSDEILLDQLAVNGHKISYKGRLSMAFNTNEENELIAFDGYDCSEVNIDGTTYHFSDRPLEKLTYFKDGESYKIMAKGEGEVTIPTTNLDIKKLKLYDHQNRKIKIEKNENYIQFKVDRKTSGKQLRLKYLK